MGDEEIRNLVTNDTLNATAVFLAACHKGSLYVVKQFLHTGIDPNARGKNGETCLLLACQYGHLDLFSLLMEYKVEIDVYDHHGSSPLKYSIGQKTDYMAQTLLAQGAKAQDLRFTTISDISYAFRRSCELGLLPIGNHLLSMGLLNYSPDLGLAGLYDAVKQCHINMIQLLIENGVPINTQKAGEKALLDTAIETMDIDVVKYLIEHGANLDPRSEIDVQDLSDNMAKVLLQSSLTLAMDPCILAPLADRLMLKANTARITDHKSLVRELSLIFRIFADGLNGTMSLYIDDKDFLPRWIKLFEYIDIYLTNEGQGEPEMPFLNHILDIIFKSTVCDQRKQEISKWIPQAIQLLALQTCNDIVEYMELFNAHPDSNLFLAALINAGGIVRLLTTSE